MCHYKGVPVRTDEVHLVEIDAITFNASPFSLILIPITHINFDKQNNKRSSFSVEKITEFVCLTLDGIELLPDGRKEHSNYFVYVFKFEENNYKLVFSIADDTAAIRLLTLFRIRRIYGH